MSASRFAPARLRHVGEHTVAVVRELRHEWRDDRIGGLAGEVAFFNVLSLFPALLATAAALGSLEAITGGDVAERAEKRVVETFEDFLSEEASGTTGAIQQLFDDTSTGALTVGIIVTLWAASRGFTAVINALDVVYDLDERRSYIGLRSLALGLAAGTVVVVAIVLTMLVLGPLFGTGEDVADWIGAGGMFAALWDWVRWPVVVIVMVLWAATVFHVAPNHRTPWRWDLPGAVLTAMLWGALSLGFRGYLLFAPDANQVLGALGGALIVLLWLYLLALGLLVGGELNAILAVRHEVTQLPRREDPLTPFARRAATGLWTRLRRRVR